MSETETIVMGTDGRLAALIKERERLRHRLKECREDMIDKPLGSYFDTTKGLRSELVTIDRRIIEEAMNYGQTIIPGC